MTNERFYQSREWRALRLFVLRRDRWKCVLCGRGVYAKGTARVDHIRTRKEAPHLERDPRNLRTLCVWCDNQRHAEKGRGTNDYGATPTGQPIGRSHWWNRPDQKALAANDEGMRALYSNAKHAHHDKKPGED
jgi:5-methylcytosine-specific restriction protein A